MSTFLDLGVSAAIAKSLAARGITSPLPIQAAALPDALAGRDVSGRAPTGSGKTIAFGIPLMTRVSRAQPRRPRGLVLVPTRELAAQVCGELVRLRTGPSPSVISVYGGTGFEAQLRALRKGVDVVVACPGRLADLVARRACDLRDVEFVVVDEADRMADMGFLPEVKRLLDQARPDRQTLLFSATLDGDVDVLVRRYQRDPVRHEVEAAAGAKESTHVFWAAEQAERTALTADIVNAQWPAVVFCRTKHRADRVSQQLARAGVATAAIHGDRSQGQRQRALAAFASGKVQALVATDVAARGIHVDDVACVVHYDMPEDDKAYVHRSGRTGRAGAAGIVVSLVAEAQQRDLRTMQKALGLPVTMHTIDVTALAAPVSRPSPPLPSPSPQRSRPSRGSGGTTGGPRGRQQGRHGRRRTGPRAV